MGGRYNLPHKPNPYKENPTTVVQKLPINDWTDLPDLEPGDKVIREDGIAYTIAGDGGTLIHPDGTYYNPFTLKPLLDQERAAYLSNIGIF